MRDTSVCRVASQRTDRRNASGSFATVTTTQTPSPPVSHSRGIHVERCPECSPKVQVGHLKLLCVSEVSINSAGNSRTLEILPALVRFAALLEEWMTRGGFKVL